MSDSITAVGRTEEEVRDNYSNPISISVQPPDMLTGLLSLREREKKRERPNFIYNCNGIQEGDMSL